MTLRSHCSKLVKRSRPLRTGRRTRNSAPPLGLVTRQGNRETLRQTAILDGYALRSRVTSASPLARIYASASGACPSGLAAQSVGRWIRAKPARIHVTADPSDSSRPVHPAASREGRSWSSRHRGARAVPAPCGCHSRERSGIGWRILHSHPETREQGEARHAVEQERSRTEINS